LSDTANLLRALIRNRCVNDGSPDSGEEFRNAASIADYLAGSGAEVEFVEPHPGRVSAIFRVRGRNPNAPALSLIGHTDVVPVDEHNWDVDPFGAELLGDTIYGRGAVDMLSLTSAMAVVTRQVATANSRLEGDLVFAAVADEEAGSRFGVGWIVEHRPDLLATDNALTESGGVHVGDEHAGAVVLTVGEKGGSPRRLTARGRSGHGSMPWGADNAAVLAAEATLRVSQHRPPPSLDGCWRNYVLASDFPPDVTARLLDPATVDLALGEFGSAARFAHAVSHLTLSPNIIRSGNKLNVIPGQGLVELDVRILPGQSADFVDQEIRDALGDLESKVEIERLGHREPSVSRADGPLFDAVEKAVRKQFPASRILPVLTSGGTDARFIRDLGGMAYGFGLFTKKWGIGEYRSLFHGDNERIDLESLELTTTALADIVNGFLAHGARR
jgi:acetylornithine deacetylase/succinyl-diaminopimelate desuccinylase-like protein